MTKRIALLLLNVSFLIACAQRVNFGQDVLSNTKSNTPDPTVCGSPTDPIHDVWVSTDPTQVACPNLCSDGTQLQCVQDMEKQVHCVEGYPADTGNTRLVGTPQPIGTCPVTPPPPPPPQACGDHPDGSNWWIDSGTETQACQTCWDGSSLQCVYAVQSQETCSDGNIENSGVTRTGGIIQTIGTCPPQVADRDEDETVPVKPAKADILFVVDTTPTMFKTLDRLANRFHAIFDSWNDVDWQIGIMNSSAIGTMFDGYASKGHLTELQTNDETTPLQYIVKKSDPFGEPYFYFSLSREESDDGCSSQPFCTIADNEPMLSVMKAIDQRATTTNRGFFRDGAHLVMIDITAGDEHGERGSKTMRPSDLIQHYQSVFGASRESLIALSVVIPPGDKNCLRHYSTIFDEGSGGRYGTRLSALADATGGVTASVCDTDYTSALSKVKQSLGNTIHSIQLKDVPLPGSLQITFAPALNVTWTLNGQTVTFSQGIPGGTRIHAHYKIQIPAP